MEREYYKNKGKKIMVLVFIIICKEGELMYVGITSIFKFSLVIFFVVYWVLK